jgi:hypothetical protein
MSPRSKKSTQKQSIYAIKYFRYKQTSGMNQNRASLEADTVAHCSESLLGMLFPFSSSSDANLIERSMNIVTPFHGRKKRKGKQA